jgi:hypothetical protein
VIWKSDSVFPSPFIVALPLAVKLPPEQLPTSIEKFCPDASGVSSVILPVQMPAGKSRLICAGFGLAIRRLELLVAMVRLLVGLVVVLYIMLLLWRYHALVLLPGFVMVSAICWVEVQSGAVIDHERDPVRSAREVYRAESFASIEDIKLL